MSHNITISSHSTGERSMHEETVNANCRRRTSYCDKEKEKIEITSLKNEVYFRVFQVYYWLANEEIPSSKITSLLRLIEQMGVVEIKYFATRSEPVLRKKLVLIAQTIIVVLVIKIRVECVWAVVR